MTARKTPVAAERKHLVLGDVPMTGGGNIQCTKIGLRRSASRASQGAADGLDPETITERVDVPDHLVVGRSSSAAKTPTLSAGTSHRQQRNASQYLLRQGH